MGNQGADSGNRKEKLMIISSLVISLCFLQTLYMNLAAFFPIVADEEYKIVSWEVAVVLA